MRTSGAATEFPFVASVLLIAVLVVVFIAGGPSEVLRAVEYYLRGLMQVTAEFLSRLIA